MLEGKEDMSTTWLLLDANYLCHRARWSMGDLRHEGGATGAIFGFFQTILQLEQRFRTTHIAFCFDSSVSKRRQIYPQYKANRKRYQTLPPKELAEEREFHQQIIKLRMEYLSEIGFQNVLWQSGYESDDLLAVAAYDTLLQYDTEAIIVTADQDLYQCINGRVSCYNPQKHESMTLQTFHQMYGIHPVQWWHVKVLAGCASDNIPGAHGIGEKTALKFIRQELNPASNAFKIIKEFCRSGEGYKIGRQLIYLPFPGTRTVHLVLDNISKSGWRNVCKRLGFKSLMEQVPFGGLHGNQ